MIEFLDSADVVVDQPDILDNKYSAYLCPGYEVLRADKSGKLHSALFWKLVDCWSLHSSEPQTLEQILSKFKISKSATEHDLFWRCRNGIMEPSIKWCMQEREALRLVEHHLRLIRCPTVTPTLIKRRKNMYRAVEKGQPVLFACLKAKLRNAGVDWTTLTMQQLARSIDDAISFYMLRSRSWMIEPSRMSERLLRPSMSLLPGRVVAQATIPLFPSLVEEAEEVPKAMCRTFDHESRTRGMSSGVILRRILRGSTMLCLCLMQQWLLESVRPATRRIMYQTSVLSRRLFATTIRTSRRVFTVTSAGSGIWKLMTCSQIRRWGR